MVYIIYTNKIKLCPLTLCDCQRLLAFVSLHHHVPNLLKEFGGVGLRPPFEKLIYIHIVKLPKINHGPLPPPRLYKHNYYSDPTSHELINLIPACAATAREINKHQNILIKAKACSCNKEDCKQCKINVTSRNTFYCRTTRTDDIII